MYEQENEKIEKYKSLDITIIVLSIIFGLITLFIDKVIGLLFFILAFWKYVDLTYWNISLRLNDIREEIWKKKKKDRQ